LKGGVKHLNPRQGITTRTRLQHPSGRGRRERVKHLNPRQGITTRGFGERSSASSFRSVKHLNPRQGITTVGLCVDVGDVVAQKV